MYLFPFGHVIPSRGSVLLMKAVFPCSSSSSSAPPLRDFVEVDVGTYTQQHDGRQHVVDQIPEFGLQVTLPVPEYLQEREQMASLTCRLPCEGSGSGSGVFYQH